MTHPGPHATSKRLHPRLTVVRASTEARARLRGHRDDVIDARALQGRAEGLATERSVSRSSIRNRLEAAVGRAAHDLETAQAKHAALIALERDLREASTWAAGAEPEVLAAHAALAEAERQVELDQTAQRARLADLDRVLEQRATANAAMADAERKLGDLGVAEMDESGLRRELEASGHAVRSAQEAHEAAQRRLAELRAEQAAAAERQAKLRTALQTHARSDTIDTGVVGTLRSALETWDAVAETARPDQRAADLAAAWADLQADLSGVVEQAGPLPDADQLEAAERRVEAAQAELSRIEAATQVGVLTPELRAQIDAAHDAVLAAEERIGRRIGGGGARKALGAAREAERALLDGHGFASYLDVVMTGGRAQSDSPERFAAERAYRSAVAERDRLRAATTARPEMAYLSGEANRLIEHCIETLGVDPGDQVIPLLRAHPDVPRPLLDDLRAAVAEAGLRPVGISLADAARAWLAEQDAVIADQRRWREAADQVRAEAEQLDATLSALAQRIAEAEVDEAHTAEQHELSRRSVNAFESELSMRADEDARRLQRFAAAEQLRAQIAALSSTLARAEEEARAALDQATTRMAEAEAGLDRANVRLSDLSRRARSLADRLPPDRRPVGDPLTTLDLLAEHLREHADALAPEQSAAEVAVATAEGRHRDAIAEAAAAATADHGPLAEDVLDGFRDLLAGGRRLAVLDEPFEAVPHALRAELRDTIVDASAERPVVLLTDDPELLGWAIELPSEVAQFAPAEGLNLDDLPADDEPADPAVLELGARAPSTDTADSPTPTGPRGAGRR